MLDLSTSGSISTLGDVRSDYNSQKADVNIFVESKLCLSDRDDADQLREFTSHRNDFSQSNVRTCHGTAVYLLMFRIVLHSIQMSL